MLGLKKRQQQNTCISCSGAAAAAPVSIIFVICYP